MLFSSPYTFFSLTKLITWSYVGCFQHQIFISVTCNYQLMVVIIDTFRFIFEQRSNRVIRPSNYGESENKVR